MSSRILSALLALARAALLLVCWGLLGCAPSLKSANYEERMAAVERLGTEDQALLAQVARQDHSYDVRAAAARKLTDQEVLAEVALSGNADVFAAAVSSLTDQELLAKVLSTSSFLNTEGYYSEYLGRLLNMDSVFERLTDQAILTKLALDEDFSYSESAAERITDQAALEKIALGSSGKWARAAAVKGITDQAALAKIALTSDDDGFPSRLNAAERLTDQAVLAKLALGSPEHLIRAEAVRRLEDQTILAKVVEEDSHAEVRDLASGRLTAAGQQQLGQLRFEKIRKSEDTLQLRAFLGQYPSGPSTSEARARLRGILFRRAAAEKSCGAWAEFVAEFPQDPAAGEMRRQLAARGQPEKARRLGELAIDMTPQIGLDGKGQLVNLNPLPLKPAIEQFRVLLAAGADPAAVRIQGFSSDVTVQGDRWSTTHVGQSRWSVTPGGGIEMNAFQEAPRPPRAEHPVPAADGGLTLAEYAKANEGTWVAALACENVEPDFPQLAQEAAKLLEQTAAGAGER